MKLTRASRKSARRREKGQAAIFLLLALGLFLIGGIGLAVDMSNLWMHRQSSQNAADAACTAAAMDLVSDGGGATSAGGFTPGTSFKCSANSTYAPCQYAAFNGYTATGLKAGSPSTEVNVDFPTSVTGVQTCSSTTPPPAICTESGLGTSFVRVTVTDRMQSFFVGLLSGKRTMDVGAMASCGAILSAAPIPILVLDPTDPKTLDLGGTGSVPKITIYGGPQRSIQVDSGSSTSISSQGNPIIDLKQGGPNLDGSDIGVTGGPYPTPNFVYQGSPPGQYLQKPPISDPFALVPVPKKPTITQTGPSGTVTNATDKGCPGTLTCLLYKPGYYASGISIAGNAAVFVPGIYYLDGGFSANDNSCLRPSDQVGDGNGGSVFYLNSGTLNVSSNSGHVAPNGCPSGDGISTTAGTGTGELQNAVKCTTKSDVPKNLPSTITGNLLMAPCGGPYGDPLGTNDPIGEQHGILFFANRSLNMSLKSVGQPSFGGGGTSAALGSLYFHYCNSPDGTGLDTNCKLPPNGYLDQLTLQGSSGSASYIVGDIITDQIAMGGTPNIVMDLNPNALFYVLKADLLQ